MEELVEKPSRDTIRRRRVGRTLQIGSPRSTRVTDCTHRCVCERAVPFPLRLPRISPSPFHRRSSFSRSTDLSLSLIVSSTRENSPRPRCRAVTTRETGTQILAPIQMDAVFIRSTLSNRPPIKFTKSNEIIDNRVMGERRCARADGCRETVPSTDNFPSTVSVYIHTAVMYRRFRTRTNEYEFVYIRARVYISYNIIVYIL